VKGDGKKLMQLVDYFQAKDVDFFYLSHVIIVNSHWSDDSSKQSGLRKRRPQGRFLHKGIESRKANGIKGSSDNEVMG